MTILRLEADDATEQDIRRTAAAYNNVLSAPCRTNRQYSLTEISRNVGKYVSSLLGCRESLESALILRGSLKDYIVLQPFL